MRSRSTIGDVALRAQASKATVSYVLNGRGKAERISEDTIRRVLHAAESLGYRPNALARMLATQRTQLLAVVFQRGHFFSSWSPFVAEVMRGVASASVELGFDLMMHTRDLEEEVEADAITDGRLDGALVLRDDDDPVLSALLERGFPFVRFFSRSDDPQVPYVDCDNLAGGRLAAEHLIRLGHRRLIMVRGNIRSTSSNDRLAGFRAAIQDSGLGGTGEDVLTATAATDDWEPFRCLMKGPNRPTGVFVWSDDVAQEVLRVLPAIGLHVPQDVSVIGFDSLDLCNRTAPTLTSVRQPIFEMASTATRLLVDQIGEQEMQSHQILFQPQLDVRGSSGPAPA